MGKTLKSAIGLVFHSCSNSSIYQICIRRLWIHWLNVSEASLDPKCNSKTADLNGVQAEYHSNARRSSSSPGFWLLIPMQFAGLNGLRAKYLKNHLISCSPAHALDFHLHHIYSFRDGTHGHEREAIFSGSPTPSFAVHLSFLGHFPAFKSVCLFLISVVFLIDRWIFCPPLPRWLLLVFWLQLAAVVCIDVCSFDVHKPCNSVHLMSLSHFQKEAY